MMPWMKTRLARFSIVLVAVAAVIGVGGVANAQTRSGTNAGVEDFKIVGTITSIDGTKQTFVLLPDGKNGSVTISFDANTNIEGGQATLKTGGQVSVEVLQHADGSLSAIEVKPSPAGNGNNVSVDDHGHDDGDADMNGVPGQDRGHDDRNDGADDHGRDG
jgi:hypothetical protein